MRDSTAADAVTLVRLDDCDVRRSENLTEIRRSVRGAYRRATR